MSQIGDLIVEIRNLCTEKGWRINLPSNPRDNADKFSEYVFPAYMELINMEVSEAVEAYRDKVWSGIREPCEYHKDFGHCSHNHKPIGVGPELADVIIRVLDAADIWGIDIEAEIKRVITYGWTRPYQHGGRTL